MKRFVIGLYLLLTITVPIAQQHRIVLIEEFSSSTCAPCAQSNKAYFVPFITNTANSGKFACLTYRCDYPPPGDPYHTAEGGVREAYYDVQGVPNLYLDGSEKELSSMSVEFTKKYSIEAKAGLTLNYTISGTTPASAKVVATVTITPKQDITNGYLYMAVAEKKTTKNVSTNGEKEFYYVMMKMVPNANGKLLTLKANTRLTVKDSTSLAGTHIEEMSDLLMVAWVQVKDTKEVLQAVESLGSTTPEDTVPKCTSLENANWGVAKLTDGITTSISGSKGYTSEPPVTGPNNHECVEIDLGKNTAFNRVKLYPRTDAVASEGGAANWPCNFTIQVRPDNGAYAIVKTVTNDSNKTIQPKTWDLTEQNARYIKIDVTRLGLPATDEAINYRLQLAEVEAYNYVPVSSKPFEGFGTMNVTPLQIFYTGYAIPLVKVTAPGHFVLRIIDAQGKMVFSRTGNKSGSYSVFRSKPWPGVFFVQAKGAGFNTVKKMIIF